MDVTLLWCLLEKNSAGRMKTRVTLFGLTKPLMRAFIPISHLERETTGVLVIMI